MLGPLEARVPGQMDEVRLGLATEVATYLALQTAPVHPSVLAASVWPRGVTAEVRDATIERVREWLGHATDGSYLLRENDEGRLFLADDVAVDWHAFCTLVQRSRGVCGPDGDGAAAPGAAADPRAVPRRSRARPLRLAGPHPAGHHGRRLRSRRRRTGWSSCPPTTPTAPPAPLAPGCGWCRTRSCCGATCCARSTTVRAGPGVAAAVDEMWVVLSERDADLEAETEALVEELVPGSQPLVS